MPSPRLPNPIKVGSKGISVRRVKNLKADDGSHANGLYSTDEHLITITRGLSLVKEQGILCHEILHAIFDGFPEISINEEQIATYLGDRLAQVIRDNPRLVSYLLIKE